MDIEDQIQLQEDLKNQMDNFKTIISQYQFDNEVLQQTLIQLENVILPNIYQLDKTQYGYNKYLIADKYLFHTDASNKERDKYKGWLELYESDFLQYINATGQKLKQKKNKNVFLILGNTGKGKSSFVQKLTKNLTEQIGHGQASYTKKCNEFQNKEGIRFIDTPGINDTEKDREEILLVIVRYLHENKIKAKNIFIIYVQSKDVKISYHAIKVFSYAYFLYEQFKNEKDQISSQELKQFIDEYDSSQSFLNWNQRCFHLNDDEFSNKRKKIFSEKDQALNYFQHFNNFHIVVTTFFDQKQVSELKYQDKYLIDMYKQQIWSNKTENLKIFKSYKSYIQSQEQDLFKKIEKIKKIEQNNYKQKYNQQIKNILLIGNSQIGKSSFIEQLTGLKGLRGSGKNSETKDCKTYLVQFDNVIYRFIDTPGLEGTEQQDPFHNLKIIGDFLRRNYINEFKILYMIDAKYDNKDELDKVLTKLIIFIEDIFDQDGYCIDLDFLNFAFELNQKSNLSDKFWLIKNSVLKVNLKPAEEEDEEEEDSSKEEEKQATEDQNIQIIKDDILSNPDKEEDQVKEDYNTKILKDQYLSVNFQYNYLTSKNEFIELNQEMDKEQQNELFKAINQIEEINIDKKIIGQIKQEYQFDIIDNTQDYQQAYVQIKKMYEKFYYFQQQKAKNESEKKSKIQEELNKTNFILIGEIYQTEENKKFINDQFDLCEQQLHYDKDQLKKKIRSHFITPKFTPVLFETETTSKFIFISRKQQYFNQYSHKLGRFYQPDNQNHIQILEQLSKIKILQEILIIHHEQQKYIDSKNNRTAEEVNAWIENFISGMNVLIGAGLQIYRYTTYYRLAEAVEAAYKLAHGANVLGVWMNSILATVSIGLDMNSYLKGHICGKQMALNSIFNVSSGLTSIAAFLWIPGYGWAVGAVAGGISLIGQSISASKYTSSTTFDQTIGLFLNSILDDVQPNHTLSKFQKSDLLKKKFQITQQQSKEEYEMYRKLELEKYNEGKQKELLQKLFKISDLTNLKNQISQHIIQNYISNLIQVQFKPNARENRQEYLKKILKYLNDNNQVIDTFYNRYKNKKMNINKVKEFYKDTKVFVETKLKSISDVQNDNNHKNDITIKSDSEELYKDEKIQQYEKIIIQFLDLIKLEKYTYNEQKEFGNGYIRKNNRFPILFNSYCNLVYLKMEYLYEQQIISDLCKDQDKRCFYFKDPQKSFDNFWKKEDSEQTIKIASLLQIIDKQYIANRYLQKIQGLDSPFFAEEIIDGKLDYSIDLHDLIAKSNDFNTFIDEIRKHANQIQIEGEVLKKIQDFYDSVIYIQEVFK